jgi:DNA-binding response OmpR family regulator
MVQDVKPTPEFETDDTRAAKLGATLIVEDDPRMQKVLRRIFTEEHYAAVVAGEGQTGLDFFCSERFLALALDLILPHISRRELCQPFKSHSSEVPIVVLRAITEGTDSCAPMEIYG